MSRTAILALLVVVFGLEASASANRALRGKRVQVSHKSPSVGKRAKVVTKSLVNRLFPHKKVSIATASPRQQAKILKRLGDSPAFSQVRKVLRAKNSKGENMVAAWVLKTDTTRAKGIETGFALDHTGLVFLFGEKRLPITPRLLSRIDIPAATIQKGIIATSKSVQGAGEQSFTPMVKLGYFGRGFLLTEFETLSRGGMRMTEHFSLQTPHSIMVNRMLREQAGKPNPLFGILKDNTIPM